ncbi:LemA family protein [Ilumatobacter sp.]|uniref:LemA family protein n=1 Tax=Ilumatobacter sp. TaxID=1967498 RepID=UPI003AF9FEFD
MALLVVLVALVPGVWWVSYTRLVAARSDVDDSWAEVDAELLRRYELATRIVETASATSDPDRIEELIHWLDAAVAAPRTPEAANEFEPPLGEAIDRLAGPILRDRLDDVDDRIAVAGSFYNTRVEQLDRRVRAFASGFVARRHGFERATFFEF